MKKRFLYPALLIMFVAASAFMLIRITKPDNKNAPVYSELLPRKISLAYAAEWTVIKNNADVLIRQIKETPSDIKSLLALTALYIREGRNTGNLNYYNEAALKCIHTILEK